MTTLVTEANRMSTGLQIKAWNDQMIACITQGSSILTYLSNQKTAMQANTTDFTASDVTEMTNIISALKTAALALTI